MIPEDKIAEIRQVARISDYISQHVQIRRRGRTMTALCPFHAEKTPSFSINDEKGFYYCFGCGEKGNVFTFLMRLENLSFPEAVRKVAERQGIEVIDDAAATPGGSQREAIFKANAAAAEYFRRCFKERPEAEPFRVYLAGRGVGDEAAERFVVGAAPTSGDGLLRWLEREGHDTEAAAQAGLLVERSGALRDRFRARLMFPIRDTQGRVVGFGGRGIDEDTVPKYLNSSESEVYRKSRALYGIYEAREALREGGRLVLVEGYLDVIALTEAGIGGVVATCGTALTADQARMMRRFSGEVVTLFDGDRAGIEAAARSFPVFIEAGLWPRVASPSDGEDPDSFVRKRGAAAMNELIDRATPLVEPFMRYTISRESDDSTGRARAAGRLAELLGALDDPFQRDLFIKQAALWTGISPEVLAKPANPRGGAQPPASRVEVPVRRARGGAPSAEELLISLVLADSTCAAAASECDVVTFMAEDPWREVAARVVDDVRRGALNDPGVYLDLMGEHERARIATRLTEDGFSNPELCAQMLKDSVAAIERAARKRKNRELVEKIRKQEELGVDVVSEGQLQAFKPGRLPDA